MKDLRECIDDLIQTWKDTGFPVFLVATADDVDRIPPSIASFFKQHIACDVSYYVYKPNMLHVSDDLVGS